MSSEVWGAILGSTMGIILFAGIWYGLLVLFKERKKDH